MDMYHGHCNIHGHYIKNCTKLVPFKEHKIFFAVLNSPSLERLLPLCKHHSEDGLHYGNNCSRLVPFEDKNIFALLNSPSLEQLSP